MIPEPFLTCITTATAQGVTARISGQILDDDLVPIPASALNTLRLWLYKKDTSAILNGCDGRNILNDNNATVDSSGNLVVILAQADNPFLGLGSIETHVARIVDLQQQRGHRIRRDRIPSGLRAGARMTFTWKQLLAILVLASAAFGAGALVTHNLGVDAARAAQDSAAAVNHTRDSVAFVVQLGKARSDSIAHLDATLVAILSATRALDSAAVASAKDEAAAASTLLATTKTTADSVVLYRDQVVPALQLEVSNLTIHARACRFQPSRRMRTAGRTRSSARRSSPPCSSRTRSPFVAPVSRAVAPRRSR